MTETDTAPAVTGFHHFSPTVSDVEASAQWYERVFRMNRVPVPFPTTARRRAATPFFSWIPAPASRSACTTTTLTSVVVFRDPDNIQLELCYIAR